MHRLGRIADQVSMMTTLPEAAAPAEVVPAAGDAAGFKPLHGKRALVTGGSRGVGESCCLRLAEFGCDVAINYARTADRAEGVKAKCEALGVKAVCVQADVSTDAQCKRLVDETVAALGGLDILVNNAGFTKYIDFSDLDAVQESDWHELMSANVYGQFNVGRAALPFLKQSGEGSIVNLGSQSGIGNSASSIPYGVTKAACHGLTRMMSRAFAPDVRVNCVAPGFINTEWQMVGTAQSSDLSVLKFESDSAEHQAKLDEVAAGTLLDKACGPDDVADAVMSFVVFNKFVTGEILSVTGGNK
jgi:3-oxoacyl-[acyl-carrier protein] reductase